MAGCCADEKIDDVTRAQLESLLARDVMDLERQRGRPMGWSI
jgi:hypothetical protein